MGSSYASISEQYFLDVSREAACKVSATKGIFVFLWSWKSKVTFASMAVRYSHAEVDGRVEKAFDKAFFELLFLLVFLFFI